MDLTSIGIHSKPGVPTYSSHVNKFIDLFNHALQIYSVTMQTILPFLTLFHAAFGLLAQANCDLTLHKEGEF
jgi:hypothetical protein